jgi:DNA (cytosine-5)-methyltransferase 3A
MSKKITVLSLFDGLSGARVALDFLGIECTYYASEIDGPAMEVSKKNYPDIIQLGSVEDIKGADLPHIDLLIGGSPCQSLSGLNAFRQDIMQAGLKGKSKLFFEYVRILQEVKPKYFLLENVASMNEAERLTITQLVGAQPIRINSELLTAQMRDRLYWTNIPNVGQPQDKGIKLQDILLNGYTEREKALCFTQTYYKVAIADYIVKSLRQLVFTHPVKKVDQTFFVDGKEVTVVKEKKYVANHSAVAALKPYMRKLDPIEAERLQGLPEVKRTIYLYIWKENYQEYQKKIANAETQSLIEEKCVGSVEESKLQNNVVFVEQDSQVNYQRTNKHVVKHVLINCEESKVEIYSQNKLLLSVSFAEEKNLSHLQKSAQDFVQLSVLMNLIQDQIILNGKEELPLNDNFLIQQKNGKNVLNIFGKEITQLVSDVKINSTIHKELLKSITSYPLKSLSLEKTLETLSSYVIHAIDGFIPNEIRTENTSIQINIKTGYTYGQTTTERYKMIGNGFTIPVIAHILKNMEF